MLFTRASMNTRQYEVKFQVVRSMAYELEVEFERAIR